MSTSLVPITEQDSEVVVCMGIRVFEGTYDAKNGVCVPHVELLRRDGHYIVEPGLVSAISRREIDLKHGGPGVRWDRPDELISLLSGILAQHRRERAA